LPRALAVTRAAAAVIVEGHGEQQSAARTILSRIWTEIAGADYLHVLPPIRRPRQKLARAEEFLKAIDLAALKLGEVENYEQKFIVVLFDADDDPACILGPQLQAIAHRERPHLDIAVTLAVTEFETWFVAAAESLSDYFDLAAADVSPSPESARQGKGTVLKFTRGRYGETVDQPRFSAKMDLTLCRARSSSFDKLCRELEKRSGR
jgi:hypothetical protein